MLVFSRCEGERIIVGDPANPDVIIDIVELRGGGRSGKVRIGVTAPRSVPVHRHEVAAAILRGETREKAIHNVHDQRANGPDRQRHPAPAQREPHVVADQGPHP
jgi:carbon storage regulator